MESPFHLFILVLHALGAMIIIGSSFVSILMLSGRRVPLPNLKLMDRLWLILGPVIGLQILTGLYLMLDEWALYGHNYWLWLKIILLVADGLVSGVAIRRQLQLMLQRPTGSEIDPQPLRARGWLSFMILLTIASIGVLLTA